jgi:Protein of unknown function (DUF1593)
MIDAIARRCCAFLRWIPIAILPIAIVIAPLAAAATHAPLPAPTDRSRLFVFTDIGNEPDDQMSLVRLLSYANSIDIEGLVASTSTWKRNVVSPETLRNVIGAYGEVRDNLLQHELGWPTADSLLKLVSAGRPAYGLAGIAEGTPSQGALRLLEAAQRPDPRPLWVALWGGGSTLAEALAHARRTLTGEQLAALVARLRVYSISDQDDAGPWIRREFPGLCYIVKPSTEDGAEYASATWTGISGDVFYRNGEGADGESITQEWLQKNIRNKGSFGAHYPRHLFIMEGDTPSFLGLIPNGLDAAHDPSWGGWGGRYLLRRPYGETRPIWTQGGDSFPRVTSADTVIGVDGRAHTSDQATIWRWRRAFQNDFAARMDWSLRDFAHANHAPRVVVNGDAGEHALVIDVDVGQDVMLDANGTTDPDGDALEVAWFPYPEAGFGPGEPLAAVSLGQASGLRVPVHALSSCQANWLGAGTCGPVGLAHVILAVTDHGAPALTRYRRVIVRVHAPALPAP